MANFQTIVNTNLDDSVAGANMGQTPLLVLPFEPQRGTVASQTGIHWHDASALMTEPLLAFPNVTQATVSPTESFIRGQLWDAVIIVDTFNGDTVTTFDGHNWISITDNDTTDRATLFVVAP
jgi:hypothetical protein